MCLKRTILFKGMFRFMNIEFNKGVKDGLPICFGYLSVAFAFGIFAVGEGLTVIEAVLISMTNLTSAGQLAAVPIIASGGTLFELAVSQLVINLRYALMSISLSQKLDSKIRLSERLLIAFGNTDEVFAVASANNSVCTKSYMYGLIFTPYIGWSVGTLFGAVAGNILPHIIVSALGIAIYGMFVAIIVPQAKKNTKTALCVITAVVLGCVFRYIPLFSGISQGFVIIICAISASALFALIAPIKDTEEQNTEGTAENE